MEMLFVLFGLIWTGVFLLGFALYHSVRNLIKALRSGLSPQSDAPAKKVPKDERWTRDWESLENNINK